MKSQIITEIRELIKILQNQRVFYDELVKDLENESHNKDASFFNGKSYGCNDEIMDLERLINKINKMEN